MNKYIQHEDLVLTQVCGEYLLVASGSALDDCPYVNRLNPIEADLWTLLSQGKTLEEITIICSEKYNMDPKKIKLLLLLATKKMLDAGYLSKEEALTP